MRVSTKLVGVVLLVGIFAAVVLSWVFNLFDFSAHLGDFYAIILAESVVAVPVIVYFMFRQNINYWIWMQNAPHLIVEKANLSPDRTIRRICIETRNGRLVCHNVNAVFVSIKNVKGRTAHNVIVETNLGGFNTPMIFITPTGKTSLTIPYSPTNDDPGIKEDEGAFVSAVCRDDERAKFVLNSISGLAPPPKGRDKKFMLCFCIEGDTSSSGGDRVWFPHTTKTYDWMPFDFPLILKLYADEILVGTSAFRVSGKDWMNLSAEPITEAKRLLANSERQPADES